MHLGVVVHGLHRRDVDDYADVGIGDESLEAMSATGDDYSSAFGHRVLNRGDNFFGRVDQPDVIRPRTVPLVEALVDDSAIAGIVGANLRCLDPSFSGH